MKEQATKKQERVELVKKGELPEEPKPRKPTAEMVALMADWRPEERAAAQKVVDFFECKLRLIKGLSSGSRFLLEPWQERILRCVFGRLDEDGRRIVRTLYLFVARKNGKSTFAAGIALYLAFEDGEQGAEVYCAAKDRAQARIIFQVARAMRDRSPDLSDRVLPFVNLLEKADEPTTFLKAISADAGSQQGLDPHGIIVDELHVHPNRDLLDTLESASGARAQPLEVICTTAGADRHSIAWEKHEYARRVRDGKVDDPTFYPAIFEAGERDDWKSPATWAKANPNLGISVRLDYLEKECRKAQETPTYQNAFLRYHCNIWTQQETRWMPMDRWNQCSAPVDAMELRGEPCFAGLDLSTTRDLTASVLVFPRSDGSYDVLCRFFLPREKLQEHIRTDRVPYDLWARDGWITLTDGEVVDYTAVRLSLEDDAAVYDLREIAFDRWGASKLSQELDARLGEESDRDPPVAIFPFNQSFLGMSNPTKDLLTLVLSKKIRHGNNPVLTWMADCCTVKQDENGNIKLVKPDRRKESARIDGMVALVMALDRAMRHAGASLAGEKRDVYETEGLFVL